MIIGNIFLASYKPTNKIDEDFPANFFLYAENYASIFFCSFHPLSALENKLEFEEKIIEGIFHKEKVIVAIPEGLDDLALRFIKDALGQEELYGLRMGISESPKKFDLYPDLLYTHVRTISVVEKKNFN